MADTKSSARACEPLVEIQRHTTVLHATGRTGPRTACSDAIHPSALAQTSPSFCVQSIEHDLAPSDNRKGHSRKWSIMTQSIMRAIKLGCLIHAVVDGLVATVHPNLLLCGCCPVGTTGSVCQHLILLPSRFTRNLAECSSIQAFEGHRSVNIGYFDWQTFHQLSSPHR